MSQSCKLEILSGPDRGRSVDLAGRMVLGRGEDCDLPLNDAECSRRHLSLEIKAGQVWLADLGSTNGTRLNGQPLAAPAALKDGDVIGLGQSEIRFISPAEIKPARPSLLGRISRLGPRFQVPATLVILALVIQAAVVTPLVGRGKDLVQEEALKKAGVMVIALAAANQEALRLGDELLVNIQTVLKQEGVVRAQVYDRQGRTLAPVAELHQVPADPAGQKAIGAESLTVQDLGGGLYDLASPIRLYNASAGRFEKVGTARIGFNLHKLESLESAGQRASLLSLVFLLAAAGVTAAVILRLTARPIRILRDELEEALKGDRAEVDPKRGSAELNRLAESLNRLLAKLSLARRGGAN